MGASCVFRDDLRLLGDLRLQGRPLQVGPFFSVAHYLYAEPEKVKRKLTRFSVDGRAHRMERRGALRWVPVQNCIALPCAIKWGPRKRRKSPVALDRSKKPDRSKKSRVSREMRLHVPVAELGFFGFSLSKQAP